MYRNKMTYNQYLHVGKTVAGEALPNYTTSLTCANIHVPICKLLVIYVSS